MICRRINNTGIYFSVNTFKFVSQDGSWTFEAPSGYELDAAFHRPGQGNFRGSLGDWYARPSFRIFADRDLVNQAYREEDWNRMTLRARGNRFEYWINGFKVMDYTDLDPKGSHDGIISLQIHDGSVMQIEYRNIRVRPLAQEAGK